jgi:hypothetical protein
MDLAFLILFKFGGTLRRSRLYPLNERGRLHLQVSIGVGADFRELVRSTAAECIA